MPRPTGYVGQGHETIGSDILAVQRSLEWLADKGDSASAGADPGRGAARAFAVQALARGRSPLTCGRDVIEGFDAMYHASNRGEGIGGWKVVSFEPTRAVLEKSTPHHCAMEEGIILQTLASVQAAAVVTQERCVRDGAARCEFLILPSTSGSAWTG